MLTSQMEERGSIRRTVWLTILVFVISALVWLIIFVLVHTAMAVSSGEVPAASVGASGSSTQQVAGNGVTVTATLLKDQAEGTAIKLALDTYFVNLVRYDFEEFAVLRDENGKIYPVMAVEQASIRKPHYRQAVLRFAKVAPEAKVIELIVKDVAGVKERTFHWSMAE